MRITITPKECGELDIDWGLMCELTGMNPWAYNEGRITEDHEIELTEGQAKELGLL